MDCMLRYLDHNLTFHIFTDASDYQMGAVIVQQNPLVQSNKAKGTPVDKKEQSENGILFETWCIKHTTRLRFYKHLLNVLFLVWCCLETIEYDGVTRREPQALP